MGTILLDGMFAGEWRIATRRRTRDARRSSRSTPIAAAELPALTDEGTRLLAFAAAGAEPEIVVGTPTS